MSSEIGLNDVKPGMWVEFDDADGHYAGEPHEMKNPESMVDVLIMSMGHKPPLYIETEDEGNLVVFLDFGDGYSTGSARNVHVYESKPETESVKQAEDDGEQPFWKGKTCGEMAHLHVKVTYKNGDVVTGVTNEIGDIDNAYCLSAGFSPDEEFFPDERIIESIELVDDVPYTMADLPKEPGFYKARTESVWKHDGKRWMPVLSHDGTIAPAFPCQSQSRSQFFKTSVRDGRFPFTKVEASFE